MSATPATRVKVAIVTNIPAPYRIPIYNLLARDPSIDLTVFFCAEREPDRQWKLPEFEFRSIMLRQRILSYRSRYIHTNPDIWRQLRALAPDVIVTTGFNPTHLLAYLYTRLHRGCVHIAMTDGTLASEASLGRAHRIVRRWVFGGTRAFIGAAEGSLALYRSYGVAEGLLFRSCLCIDNRAFDRSLGMPKQYDLIFCGRMVTVKNPLFALDVARSVAQRLGRRVSICYVGSGDLEGAIRDAAAAQTEVDVALLGHANQQQLPERYGASRVLVFPTSWDPWGVIANEAGAAGLPVVTTPAAGSAGELVQYGRNGYVLPLDLTQWTDALVALLSDDALYAAMSREARVLVEPFNFENAARGIRDAVRRALPSGSPFAGADQVRSS